MVPSGPQEHDGLMDFVRLVAARDMERATSLLESDPELVRTRIKIGATRQNPEPYRFGGINHYVYAGDTVLHVAAASHQVDLVATALRLGAEPGARNRRGAQPLHYAADGRPDFPGWDGDGQAAVIRALVAAGADPDATDKSGVAALHRAVRTRSSAAVAALLGSGADPNLRNGSGSAPMTLARLTTGRGGSGSPQARDQQSRILGLLEEAGGVE